MGMIMKKWTWAITITLLILSFQNCQKSNLVTNDNGSTPTPAEFQKSLASVYPTLQLWDYQQGFTYDININSGRIEVYSSFGNNRETDLCLTDALKNQVQNLISGAQICVPDIPAEQFVGKECSMSYEYPYAILVNGADTVRLGEKTNGCDVPTNLCGDQQAQALKDFSQTVLSSVAQLPCQ